MLRLLFVGDLGSAQLFSTRRKCEAQRIFACFEQALSQCSAANTNQLTNKNTHPSHWRKFGKGKSATFNSQIEIQCCISPYGSVNRGFPVRVSLGKKMKHLTYLSDTLIFCRFQLLFCTYLHRYFWHSLKIIIPVSILAF